MIVMIVHSKAFAFAAIVLLSGIALAETTGNITFETKNESVTTGLYGATLGPCGSDADCPGYKCFKDFDTGGSLTATSGVCRSASETNCVHDNTDNIARTVANTYYYCSDTSNTQYRQCGSGTWSSGYACASGKTCSIGAAYNTSTVCVTPTNNSGNNNNGGAGGNNQTLNLTSSSGARITITSLQSSLELVQGNSSIVVVAFRNSGNSTLSGATLSISGVLNSWYAVTPSSIATIFQGDSANFSTNFSLPDDADIAAYSAVFTVAASGVSDSKSMQLKVLPNERSVMEIDTTFIDYMHALALMEANLTGMNLTNETMTALLTLLDSARSKLQQANESIIQHDYYNAKLLLDDVKSTMDSVAGQMEAQVVPPASGDSTIIIIIIAVVAVIACVVVVVLKILPGRKHEKKMLGEIREMRNENRPRK